MHHPTYRIAHTTAVGTPAVVHWLEREIAQWVHPMKDRSDDPSHHERTLLPRSYISLPISFWLTIVYFYFPAEHRYNKRHDILTVTQLVHQRMDPVTPRRRGVSFKHMALVFGVIYVFSLSPRKVTTIKIMKKQIG